METKHTPETDIALKAFISLEKDDVVLADFARRLETQRNELAAALRFYADPVNWCEIETGIGMQPSKADMDSGEHASTTLAKLQLWE